MFTIGSTAIILMEYIPGLDLYKFSKQNGSLGEDKLKAVAR